MSGQSPELHEVGGAHTSKETIMIRVKVLMRAVAVTAALAAASSCSSGGGKDGGVPTNPGGGTTGGGALELNSGNMSAGATYQHRFTRAGTFRYFCIFHAPMTGSVVVDANAADTLVNVSITSSSAPFAPASVKPGGRVVWTNNTAMVHTVTSE